MAITNTQITGPFSNGYLDFKREIYQNKWIPALVYGSAKIYPLFENIRQPGEALKVDSVRLPVMNKLLIQAEYNDATGQIPTLATTGTVEFPITKAISVFEHIGHTGNKVLWAQNAVTTFAQQEAIIKDELIFERLLETKSKGASEIKFGETLDRYKVNILLNYFRTAFQRHAKRVDSNSVIFFIDNTIDALLQQVNAFSGSKTVEGTGINIRTAFGYNLITCDLSKYGIDILATTTNNIITFEQVYIPLSSGILGNDSTWTGHQFLKYLENYDAFVIDPTLVMYHTIQDTNAGEVVESNLSDIITTTNIGSIEGSTIASSPTETEIIFKMREVNDNTPATGYGLSEITATSAKILHESYTGSVKLTYKYDSALPDISDVITVTELGTIEGSTTATLPVDEDILLLLTAANPNAPQDADGYTVSNISVTQATIAHKNYEGTINVTYTYTPATS